MPSLVAPENFAVLWGMIALGTAMAIWLEQRYRWGARLSSPVLALLIAMVLSNTRIAPSASPAYDFVTDWLVPLAIPLLLFRANIRAIFRTGGRLFLAFHVSSVGTVAGTVIAVLALRAAIPSPDLEHAAGIMAASYVGGAVNFMAVKASFNVRESITNPLIVADNFVMAAAFIILLGIAGSRWFLGRFRHADVAQVPAQFAAGAADRRKPVALMDLAWSFAFAFVVLGIATLLGRATTVIFGGADDHGWGMRMLAVLCMNKFVLITAVTLFLATVLARPLSQVNGAEECGSYFLLLFLFTLGLPADLIGVLRQAPLFFVFCAIIAASNIVFTLLAGKLLGMRLEELLVAINANLGGAPSAAAMASSAGWPQLVLPAILVGIWGYVIGTPIGVIIIHAFLAGK